MKKDLESYNNIIEKNMNLKKIKVNKEKNLLILDFAYKKYSLTSEFLRVNSPSANVQNHGKPILQYGKQFVLIKNVEKVGRYAIKITFDDNHNTGLYSFEYLYFLSLNKNELWNEYLKNLEKENKFRNPNESTIKIL